MRQSVNMIMIGTSSLETIRKFYEEGLGWKPYGRVTPLSVSYDVGTSVLVFLNADYLAKESGIPAGANARLSMAIFVTSREEVEESFKRALGAGGRETSALRDRDGGLFSGYLTDPEGNSWEIVWSPQVAPDASGRLTPRASA